MTARHRIPTAQQLVTQLLAIPGRSGQEQLVADFLVKHLRTAGLPESAIRFDTANRRSPIGGQIGNLIVKLPGSRRAPRRLFMAHMDTVPLCVGCKPIKRGRRIVSASRATALGADDRSGVAVLLHTAMRILSGNLPHPPLTFLWCVQEEIGLIGAHHVSVAQLGRPAFAFNFDSSDPDQLIIGATGTSRMNITIRGVAAHAGVHPERGVSATAIAAMAVADLQRSGWHGLIQKGSQRGTSNVGVIQAGEATNVVTESVLLRAEARSHNPRFRMRIIDVYRKAFTRAAAAVRNESGQRGSVTFEVTHNYEAFELKRKDAVVVAAADAVRHAGLEPRFSSCNGGLDANWMTPHHGIPTVTLGTGQHEIHTVNEYMDLDEFAAACRAAIHLATNPEQ